MFHLKRACALCVLAAALATIPATTAESGPPKIFFEGSGTLGIGPQSCLLFTADASNLVFAIGNTDGFGPGDRVWVTGVVNNQSQLCFPVVIPALEDNTINRFFAGCGETGPGPQGCLVFETAEGESFFLTGEGPFDLGEEIFVTGIVRPESFACFPVLGTELQAVTVDPCAEPDINGDGVVNALDLLLLLQAWGECDDVDCPEDINRDGAVGLLDLLILLSAWG